MQGAINRIIRALLIAAASVVCMPGNAQKITQFTREDEKFIEELTDMFKAERRDEGQDFIERTFAPIWFDNPAYKLSERQYVYDYLDKLIKNKNKVYPDYHNYLRAIIAFPHSGKTELDFIQWHEVLNKTLDDKKMKRYTGELLEASAGLFEDLTFYRTETARWVSSSKGYKFVFDSVPRIEFPALTLKCYSRGDSSVVYETAGNYLPTIERWQGTKGKVTWQRAGFDPAKTYAQFGEYEIKVKGSTFSVDSVTFYNEFFDKPLQGVLTEKILADKSTENATYPKFESYYKRLQIQNIVKDVDYDGGFTMAGTQLLGSGTTEEPAILTFNRDSKKFLVATSLQFDIKPERITSPHTAILFLLEKDSISHPDVNLSFDKLKRQVVLLRSEEGISKAPFHNTYHEVDMYFETIYWNIDDPLLKMGALEGSQQRYAAFESSTYFKKKRYESMMGISTNHPLYELKQVADHLKSAHFRAYDVAKFHRFSEEEWHKQLIDLNNKGFINYNLNTRDIQVLPKLYWNIENAICKRDYDAIQFSSQVDNGFNAQLSLLNYDMQLKGVENFQLSDSQQVRITPANGEVILKKNRDFTFGGRVFAGNFEFIGPEYSFSYEKFQLDLIKVDSCRIYVEDESLGRDDYGRPIKRRLKNVLNDLAGNIRVDSPTNKGGCHSKAYPQFPIFTCTKTSYVYWDKPDIQKGQYKRDNFYYQVQPFTIDSLDNFSKKDLRFNGTLVSAGIFPDIEEPLVLMDDYSLGFTRSTGEAGTTAYAGKAKVKANLKLDYSGLKGAGDFNYLTASASSDEFTYLPDSMLGITKTFANREQTAKVEIPKAKCDTTALTFLAKADQLNVSSIDTPIDFFESDATLEGTLRLRPTGMRGTGDMVFSGATLSSHDFSYTRRKILADTSSFQLAGMDESEGNALAFKTDNVNANVDFDKRQGLFKSNGGETKIEFPTNQYICYMDQFTWFMDKDELDLASSRSAGEDLTIDTSEEFKRSNFYSIAAGQDSLNFLAPRAKYDLRRSLLTCQKIQYIVVADSKITPDSAMVVIEKHADMRPLKKAGILSNYTTQYHQLYNADVKIEGRRSYYGSADYTYIDESKTEQTIHFESLKTDSTHQTIGSGSIAQEQQFFLSPTYEYYGKVELVASTKPLTFEGGVRILHNCELMPRTFFRFRAEINPDEIYIPVDTVMRNMDMEKLGAGVVITGDSPLDVYPTFFSDKREGEDQSLISAIGFLYYDKATRCYLVGSKEKIKQPKLAGNLVVLNTQTCELSADGRVDFNVDYGMVKMTNVGDMKYKSSSKDVVSQTTTLINFPIEESAMKRIAEQTEQWPNLQPVDIGKTMYEKSLTEILGQKEADKIITDLALGGSLKKTIDEFEKTFCFADLKWFWNAADQTFQTMGPLGIGNIGKKQLFRYVKGKIEIEKKHQQDVIRIYLELDAGTWYYFEYKLGIMNVISSDKEFLNILAEVKDDKRKFEEGKTKYTWQVINNKKKRDDFVSKFPEFN
ncbi:MAG: hypothetical protein ACKVOR_09590 [Flavobacteriales bacterium]